MVDGEHITAAFILEPVIFKDEDGQYMISPTTAALCLCGWAFVHTYSMTDFESADVARTLAEMQAREHRNNPLRGMRDAWEEL